MQLLIILLTFKINKSMNRKETLIWSITDNVIVACDIPRADGTHSITRDSNGTEVPLEPISKDKLFDMMKQNGVYLDNNDNPYDAVFAANMCKADYLGSSITDEKHLCLYVKDVIDDVDGYDGIVFNRWYADMCRKGVQVDWYECR